MTIIKQDTARPKQKYTFTGTIKLLTTKLSKYSSAKKLLIPSANISLSLTKLRSQNNLAINKTDSKIITQRKILLCFLSCIQRKDETEIGIAANKSITKKNKLDIKVKIVPDNAAYNIFVCFSFK